MANTDIIIHDKKDNVGVIVIEKVNKGQDCECWIMEDDSSTKIKSIKKGEHVHVHNVKTKKW